MTHLFKTFNNKTFKIRYKTVDLKILYKVTIFNSVKVKEQHILKIRIVHSLASNQVFKNSNLATT